MAHYKRKKSKRQVRCTICTTYRWMGNSSERRKPEISAHRDRQRISREMKDGADGRI